MCTKIGHIQREEIHIEAPGHAEQEWTAEHVGSLVGKTFNSAWRIADAHNASLAKERSRWDDWHKFTDEGLAQHDEQIVQQLRTQLAAYENVERIRVENPTLYELAKELSQLRTQLAEKESEVIECNNYVKQAQTKLAVAEALFKQFVESVALGTDKIDYVNQIQDLSQNFLKGDTSALDAAIEEALERATQEQKELNDCIEQTWDVLEKDSGAKAWPWGLLSAAKQVAEAQKPLVEALNFYAHGGGGIHIATEALAKIGGKHD